MNGLLDIDNLSVSFRTPWGELQALRGVSLSLLPGEILAVVGESGCGKSVLCRSILGLLPSSARVKGGRITLDGLDLTACGERAMGRVRGRLCSMVFQDPLASLDPTLSGEAQIGEAVDLRTPGLSRRARRRRVEELLDLVGLSLPEARRYPCQLSGGMCQRVALAIALAAEPKLLVADEPTTALDVTVQAQILDLLETLGRQLGAAILLVTHDFGVVARLADRVSVMYAGRIVETGTAEEVLRDPRHPYTWGLLRALPGWTAKGEPLYAIPGFPPSPLSPPPGDAFACRNEFALAIDYEEEPPMFPISDTHFAATWLLDPRAPRTAMPTGGPRRV